MLPPEGWRPWDERMGEALEAAERSAGLAASALSAYSRLLRSGEAPAGVVEGVISRVGRAAEDLEALLRVLGERPEAAAMPPGGAEEAAGHALSWVERARSTGDPADALSAALALGVALILTGYSIGILYRGSGLAEAGVELSSASASALAPR